MGGSPSPPPAPDYGAAAREQGAANIEAARLSGKMNNPNVYNPYGTQTVVFGEFNQPAYDAAMAKYNADLADYTAKGGRQQEQYIEGYRDVPRLDEEGRQIGTDIDQPFYGYRDVAMTMPKAPERKTYETSFDQPSMYQTFSPEQQALYNQDIATRQQVGKLGFQGAQSLEGVIGTPINYGGMAPDPSAYQAGAAIAPSAMPDVLDPSQLPGRPDLQSLSPLDLASLPQRANVSAEPTALNQAGLPGAPSAYTTPTNLPPMPSPSADLYNRTYQATLARPMEDLAIRRENVQSDLIARGLRGGRGYQDEMRMQDRAENDARMQGVLAANQAVQQQYGMDLQTRQQAQQEALANAGLSYQQGLGLRQQSMDEQARQFEQQMQGSGRTFQQQQALRDQAMAEQAGQFGQQSQAATMTYGQQQALRNQVAAEQAAQFQQALGLGQQSFTQQMAAQQQQAAQAQLAFQQQSDLRRAQIAEYLAKRQTPLNEISAALSQTQVQNPFSMPGYSQNTNIAPPPIYQAASDTGQHAMDVYNQQAASSDAFKAGLFSLGSSAIKAGTSYGR